MHKFINAKYLWCIWTALWFNLCSHDTLGFGSWDEISLEFAVSNYSWFIYPLFGHTAFCHLIHSRRAISYLLFNKSRGVSFNLNLTMWTGISSWHKPPEQLFSTGSLSIVRCLLATWRCVWGNGIAKANSPNCVTICVTFVMGFRPTLE